MKSPEREKESPALNALSDKGIRGESVKRLFVRCGKSVVLEEETTEGSLSGFAFFRPSGTESPQGV